MVVMTDCQVLRCSVVPQAKRGGGDDGEPAGDLPAPGSAERPLRLDLDAGVDERGAQPLGEVLQLV